MKLHSRLQFLNSLFRPLSRRGVHPNGAARKHYRPGFDNLEDRTVPAIIPGQLPPPPGGPPGGPAPNASQISGFVFCDDNDNGILETALGEHALADVKVKLIRIVPGGPDQLVAVDRTSDNGLYFFGDLRRGRYRIVEVTPDIPDIQEGAAYTGTINGQPGGSVINRNQLTLRLPASSVARDFNFTEICAMDEPETPPPPPPEQPPQPEPAPVGECPIPNTVPTMVVDGTVVTVTGSRHGDVVSISRTDSGEVRVTFTYLVTDAQGNPVRDANNNLVVLTQTETGAFTEVNFNGEAGNDKLVVDNGADLLGLTINYNGGLGTDTLRLKGLDADDNASQTLTAGQAEDTGSMTFQSGSLSQTINYEDIGEIIDTVFVTSLTINANNFKQPFEIVEGTALGGVATARISGIHRDHKAVLCHHTGSSTNPAVIIEVGRPAVAAHQRNHGDPVLSDEPPTTPLEFANKANVTLNAGNGSDFFLVNLATRSAGLQSLTVNGGNGKDAIEVQAIDPAVSFHYDVEED